MVWPGPLLSICQTWRGIGTILMLVISLWSFFDICKKSTFFWRVRYILLSLLLYLMCSQSVPVMGDTYISHHRSWDKGGEVYKISPSLSISCMVTRGVDFDSFRWNLIVRFFGKIALYLNYHTFLHIRDNWIWVRYIGCWCQSASIHIWNIYLSCTERGEDMGLLIV